MQAHLQEYGELLAKLLGIAPPAAADASTGRCSLFLDSHYLSELSRLPSLDHEKLQSLLMASAGKLWVCLCLSLCVPRPALCLCLSLSAFPAQAVPDLSVCLSCPALCFY